MHKINQDHFSKMEMEDKMKGVHVCLCRRSNATTRITEKL